MRFVFHPFELDDETLELRRDGRPVAIAAQPLELLLLLIRRRGQVVSRAELHQLLWKGTAVGETSLGQAVRLARRALGGDAGVQHYIRNVRGRGYRFAAPVEEVSRAPAATGRATAAAPDARPAPAADAFFGRRSELAVLDQALAQAEAGSGDALWIRGEEGVGKTRLLAALADRARRAGARVLSAGCLHDVWSSPYRPFTELIAAARELDVGEALWRDLGDGAGVLARVAGSAATPDDPGAPREQERQRVFEATSRLFDAIAERGLLLVLVDDLHWAEPATLAMTHHVARRAAAGGWLIVGSLRDGDQESEHDPRLAALLQVGERRAPLRLEGLDVGDTGALLEAMAGRPLPRDLREDIHRETGGNPFFAREIFRHLLDEGVLVDERGEWSESLRLDEVSLPDGVRRVISRRLAGFGAAARELLAAAAAAGETFHFEVVRRAAQLDEPAALDGLDEALDAHVVEPTADDEVYAFCHDLSRRVLYGEQSPARRVRLHRRLAEALVDAHGPRAALHAERIARQYHASADLPGAEDGVVHCLLAADRAAAVAAWEDEASYVGMALDLLLPSDGRRSRLLERQGLALAFSGETARAARTASEAAGMIEARLGRAAASEYLVNVVTGVAWSSSELAWNLSDEAERMLDRDDPTAWARLKLVTLWRESSLGEAPVDSPEQRAATLAALDHWESIDPTRKAGLSLVGLAFESRGEVLERAGDTGVFLALWAGEYERAIPMLHENVRQSQTHAEMAASYFYLSTIARLHAALGRIPEARKSLEVSERHLQGLPPAPTFQVARASTRAQVAHAQGTGYEDVLPLFADLTGSPDEATKWLMPTVLSVAAETYALAGREQEALRLLQAALPGMIRSPGWMTSFTLMVNAAVGAAWALGSAEWVALLEKQLREKTLAPDFRFPGTDARLSLARLCTLQERYEEAGEWFARARDVLEEQGASPLRAITDLDEARMLLRRAGPGDAAQARSLLDACTRAFQHLDMTGWRERAEAQRRRL